MSDEINFYLNDNGEKVFWFHGFWNNCIQKTIWQGGQDNSDANGFIREFLQKCSGDKIVEMLKGVLSEKEKIDLVKPELHSSFENQSNFFENHMMVRNEGTSNPYVEQNLPNFDHLCTSGGQFEDEIENLFQSQISNSTNKSTLEPENPNLSIQTGKETVGDHPYIMSAENWVGGSRKLPVLLTFSTVFMLI